MHVRPAAFRHMVCLCRAVRHDLRRAALSWDNKVVWSEGLFLRPQHLQQADRYVEKLVRGRTASLRGYGWGLTRLRLNTGMLGLGKIAIEQASGVLEDGTPFSIPDDADLPAPFEPPDGLRNAVMHLALPAYQPGAIEADARVDTDVVARWHVAEQELVDANAGDRGEAAIEVGRLRFRLLPHGADRAGFICLPVARMIELRSDRQVILDESFVAPVLDCAASSVLSGFVAEIQGLLHHRGEALAARVGAPSAGGVAEIADYLLLQVVNRHEPVFAHLASAAMVHPETLFLQAVQLAGDLATYARPEKRPPAFGIYRHHELAETFAPVTRSIRESLSMVLEQTAVPVPLTEHRYGVHIAQVGDRTLFTTAAFVLAVKADLPVERLRREFPTQIKIGPLERIKELVNVALPGIVLRALPVAPRQLPFHVGVTYFEIDASSPLWKGMERSAGLSLHVAGDFPGLEMALWAIRNR
jgi:type VI secretion system protein ImpJ